MIRQAVTCDRAGCLAALVDPGERPEHAFSDHVWVQGWRASDQGHSCPACQTDHGPVLERGECPRCMGRTVDMADGAHCHYCRTVTPHPADGWD